MDWSGDPLRCRAVMARLRHSPFRNPRRGVHPRSRCRLSTRGRAWTKRSGVLDIFEAVAGAALLFGVRKRATDEPPALGSGRSEHTPADRVRCGANCHRRAAPRARPAGRLRSTIHFGRRGVRHHRRRLDEHQLGGLRFAPGGHRRSVLARLRLPRRRFGGYETRGHPPPQARPTDVWDRRGGHRGGPGRSPVPGLRDRAVPLPVRRTFLGRGHSGPDVRRLRPCRFLPARRRGGVGHRLAPHRSHPAR